MAMKQKDSDIVLIRQDEGVCTLTLNRPEMNNAITDEMRDQLIENFNAIALDPTIRAVVIRGAGQQAFSTGMDIQALASMTAEHAKEVAKSAAGLHERIAKLDKPVIAAIRGACMGAGLELAIHCDVRLADENSRFGLPGINLGIVPSGGTISRLSQLVGAGPARAFCMTGGVINAERAFMGGLITNIIGNDFFDQGVEEMARYFASMSPVAMRELKTMMEQAIDGVSSEDLAEDGIDALARCFSIGDAHHRINALFGTPDESDTIH